MLDISYYIIHISPLLGLKRTSFSFQNHVMLFEVFREQSFEKAVNTFESICTNLPFKGFCHERLEYKYVSTMIKTFPG